MTRLFIRQFFNGTVYYYTLEKAIATGFLTEYEYLPVVTGLSNEELEEYEDYTQRIIPLIHIKNPNKAQEDQLQSLFIQRSRIIKKARSKKDKLLELLSSQDREDVSHVLVYCAEGQIDEITRSLNNIGYRVHRFDHRVSNLDREKILQAFDQGDIQILVAINCLDEGVDIPRAEQAVFCSSTGNPRQFIQRRGRILRTHPNKKFAKVYDLIVIPQVEYGSKSFESEKKIVEKELERVVHFAYMAINKYEAVEDLKRICEYYGLNLDTIHLKLKS